VSDTRRHHTYLSSISRSPGAIREHVTRWEGKKWLVLSGITEVPQPENKGSWDNPTPQQAEIQTADTASNNIHHYISS